MSAESKRIVQDCLIVPDYIDAGHLREDLYSDTVPGKCQSFRPAKGVRHTATAFATVELET